MAKVMVSFPDDFLRKVDEEARSQNRSRSELIREALRSAIQTRPDRRSWRRGLDRLRRLEKQWMGKWDSTEVIRSDRERRVGLEDRR